MGFGAERLTLRGTRVSFSHEDLLLIFAILSSGCASMMVACLKPTPHLVKGRCRELF